MSKEPEEYFALNEVFFSTTDKKGRILSSNGVFVRVSGFSKDELIGAPHNIIRHSCMPKAVFRVLWSTIQKGKPIVAYVKNQSKQGKHYWVVATVYPIENGYLSIRIKPSTPLLKTVEDLYTQTLRVEKEKGLDASLDFIVEQIKSLGFKSYEEFSLHAMIEELNSRDAKLDAESRLLNSQDLSHHSEEAKIGRKVFSEFLKAEKNSAEVSKTMLKLLESFSQLEYLSLNMIVSAHRLGDSAKGLTSVVTNFQNLARDIQSDSSRLQPQIERLIQLIQESIFKIGSVKLQSETILFLNQERLSLDAEEQQKLDQDIQMIYKLGLDTVNSTLSTSGELNQFFQNFGSEIRNLFNVVNGMDVIRLSAKIESSVIREREKTLDDYVKDMENMTNSLKSSLSQISELQVNCSHLFQSIDSSIRSQRNLMIEKISK